MLATHKTQQEQFNSLGSILMLSAWAFAMVIASFLFLYVGHLLDGIFGTSPNFMLGLFFLAFNEYIGKRLTYVNYIVQTLKYCFI